MSISEQVLLGMLDGQGDAEVLAELSLTPNQYYAAKKRIRRRLQKIMRPKQSIPEEEVP